ncbi:recombinase family protein [Neobacillus sp. MER 74]|uniref:recombinase family protein n=1 Tax=Neobacillus sp. MER 74 TaxID=2939566 RepID=UPI00204115EA|nr:recombinase family protein [Neobacillus sp. MER 74]MCM3115473.1 recombinase family protein [Neobacillus sp. MER 74]
MDTIKDIAIYLRKSRDEEGKADVLSKHRNILVEYANKHNLNYKLYEEIGSSQSIEARPEMVQLLNDIENDLYDAVLVVDLDRLTRGDLEEIGRIQRIFRESNTLVITPNRTYDFNDENNIMTNFEQLMANYEYKMIKKRMLRGKRQGAKSGRWVSGQPPFPYKYNKVTRELEVDEADVKVYDLMKKMFLHDLMPTYEIAWELNRLGIKTKRKGDWHETTIRRIIMSEIHLGKTKYGKNNYIEGIHKPLKTQEEHERILAIHNDRRVKPAGSRNNIQVLSKLIFCGKCKKALSFNNHKASGKTYIKTCTKTDKFGIKCGNNGMRVEIVYAQLFFELEQYQTRLLNSEQTEQKEDTTLQLVLRNKQDELKRLETGEERLIDLYVEGTLDKAQLKLKQEKLNAQIQRLRDEIRSIEKSLAITNNEKTDEERLYAIKQFKRAWSSKDISKKELNTLAKQIIDRIELIREGENIEIKINFL